MAKSSPIQYSFNAGEISPLGHGRIDIDKYKNGCEVLENAIPQVLGPARKRPGTRFVRRTKDSTKNSRLIPFEFSETQAVAMEFGDFYIRLHTNGGTVLTGSPAPYSSANVYEIGDLVTSGGVTYYSMTRNLSGGLSIAPPFAGVWYPQPATGELEIPSPYSHVFLKELNFAQSADVVYITHPLYPVRKLSRFGATRWVIEDVAFKWPALLTENSTATTIIASDVTGNITLTASADLFVPEHVGAVFALSITPAADYDQWTQGVAHGALARVQYQGRVYETTLGGTAGARPPLHTEGTVSDGAVLWTYLHGSTGFARVTAYTDATEVDAEVVSMLPTTAATKRWSEGAWSQLRGYPRTVTFYDDRLWFGGTTSRPQTLWASVIGDYENFEYGTIDDDALNYTINTQDLNTITWMSPGKVLAVGTASGEFTVGGNSLNDPVTPNSVRILPQTPYGCAGLVRPLRVASSTLFVQREGRTLREYTYNFDTDSYVAPNLNRLADHITVAGLVDIAYQQSPDQIVWTPDTNGRLLGFTYERAEDVVGWHRHDIGGAVESVITLPHWDGDQDVVWLIVRRTINGVHARYVEYMEKYRTGTDAFFVDCGLSYSGAPATTISGLSHLEGRQVAILADGAVHPERTVTGGAITLQLPASVVQIGIPYTMTLRTLRLEAGAEDGTAQGKTMRIHNIVFRLHETGPGFWYGPDTTTMDELAFRSSENDMDAPVPLFTGDTELLAWPGQYEQGSHITVQHRLPTPCTLVATMPQQVTNDR
jgi:hypothetical protein